MTKNNKEGISLKRIRCCGISRRSLVALLLPLLLLSGCRVKTDQSKEFHSEDDLVGAVVGATSGTIYDINLTQRTDLKLIRHPDESSKIASLKTGRIETFVSDEVVINKEICREQGIKEAFRTKENYPCSFMLNKDNPELLAQLNDFIATMRENGELKEMEQRWIEADDYNAMAMTTDGQPTPTGKPIKVGTGMTTAPMSFMVGTQWRGFEPELLIRFGNSIGRPVEIKLYDFGALPSAVQTGVIDIASGVIFDTEERRQSLALSDHYFFSPGAYFVLDNTADKGKGFWAGLKRSFNNNLLVENRWQFLARGLWVTIRITLFAIFFGSLLGIGLYLMRKSHRKWVRETSLMYSAILRGIPMVVLLMILFYVILTGFNSLVVGIVAFSLTFASFTASILNTSIEAVGHGQQEAGVALGFSRWQTFRYIIGPQALRRALPHFKSEAVSLIKNTSIVGYIAIQDLTRACDMIRSRTFEAFFPLLFITIIYFILAWLMGKLLDYLFKLGTKI